MEEEFESIEKLAERIKKKPVLERVTRALNKENKVIALYAFNSTGKTRLSSEFVDVEEEGVKTLRYSAFFEDIFVWDNENYILKCDPNSWIIKRIVDQGLESKIIDNFRDITRFNIEPNFDFVKGDITFKIASGDDESLDGIKISRGEESIFVWSVFYSLLEEAIDTLNDSKENRTTEIFNDLKWIIIDDPVSSMDDTKIVTIAVKLAEKVKSFNNNSVDFLITTHHALFFNVLFNSFKKKKKYFESYILIKDDGVFKLSRQNDSPFGYHLLLKETIKNAIISNGIEKYHFNLFRSLLEKTSSFLGYEDWTKCLSDDIKEGIKKLLQLYSHDRLSDLEPRQLSSEEKDLFVQAFNAFTAKYFHDAK